MRLTLLALLVACNAPESPPSSTPPGSDPDPEPEACLGEDLGSAVGEGVAFGSNEGMGDDYAGPCVDEHGDEGVISVGDEDEDSGWDDYEDEDEDEDEDDVAGLHGEDIALTWTAPADGRYGFSTAASTYDTLVSLLDGHDCGGAFLECDDDGGLDSTSFATGSFSEGDQVTIVIDAADADEIGDWSLDIIEDFCPDDDLGSVTGSAVATGWNTAQVTTLPEACGDYASDVTFAWTAPHAGTWVFDTLGSRFDTVLVVVDGGCDGEVLQCSDDGGNDYDAPDEHGEPEEVDEDEVDAEIQTVGFGLTSRVVLELDEGQEIVIGVGGYAGELGEFVLGIEEQDEFEAPSGDPVFPEDASCVEVCGAGVEAGCGTGFSCPEECAEDLDDCPRAMHELLECYVEEGVTCDPTEDHGIGWGACGAEHEAVEDCGKDPF